MCQEAWNEVGLVESYKIVSRASTFEPLGGRDRLKLKGCYVLDRHEAIWNHWHIKPDSRRAPRIVAKSGHT